MTDGWRPGSIGPNRVFSQNGKLLRERTRDLADNNPFASSAIDAYIANVIETGIHPERDPTWEKAWRRWGGLSGHATRESDLQRDLTILEQQALWLREIIVGGGCLTHYVTLSRRSQRVPLALEFISEDQFDDTLQWFGVNPKTRNRVFNGVEVDNFGRTVAYHVYSTHPNDLDWAPERPIRLSAEQCEYAYFKDRIGSKRGSSLLKPVVLWLWALGFYTDNELSASRIKSAWALIIKTDSELTDLTQESQLYDLAGNPITKYEAGMVWKGSPEDSITTVGPNTPTAESMPWLELIQRAIAIGMRLSHEETFRQYGKANLASARMVRNQDIKRFKPLQLFAGNHFILPTISRFDMAAVGAGIDGFPSPEAYLEQRDELLDNQELRFPGWASANPVDDAKADDMNLKNLTDTRQAIVSRGGGSYLQVISQRGFEKQKIEEAGLQDLSQMAAPGTDTGKAENTAPEPTEPEADE